MEPVLFQRFCDIAHDLAGIKIREGKESLVSARVSKRLRALKLDSPEEYMDYLVSDDSGQEIVQFLDVITTNFTSFYREPDHFELLERLIRSRLGQGRQRIRIWCAASSSGEEPWSMAVTLAEALRDHGGPVDARILATDISTRVLAEARAGVYPAARVRPVSRERLLRWFERVGHRDSAGERWSVKPELRQYVLYKRLNLSVVPFPMQGPIDAIFCRNVMIYFDQPVRQRLIAEMDRLLTTGGLLCIGHTETLTGIAHGMRILKPSVYQKV